MHSAQKGEDLFALSASTMWRIFIIVQAQAASTQRTTAPKSTAIPFENQLTNSAKAEQPESADPALRGTTTLLTHQSMTREKRSHRGASECCSQRTALRPLTSMLMMKSFFLLARWRYFAGGKDDGHVWLVWIERRTDPSAECRFDLVFP
jgi:hypothetical protein